MQPPAAPAVAVAPGFKRAFGKSKVVSDKASLRKFFPGDDEEPSVAAAVDRLPEEQVAHVDQRPTQSPRSSKPPASPAVDLRASMPPPPPAGGDPANLPPAPKSMSLDPRVRDRSTGYDISASASQIGTPASQSQLRESESNAPSPQPRHSGAEPVQQVSDVKPPAPPAPKEVYERLNQVGEGTYGKVYKARNTEDGSFVALKRIRMEIEKDGFPVTSVREIKLLQSLRHPNVVMLKEMMVSSGK